MLGTVLISAAGAMVASIMMTSYWDLSLMYAVTTYGLFGAGGVLFVAVLRYWVALRAEDGWPQQGAALAPLVSPSAAAQAEPGLHLGRVNSPYHARRHQPFAPECGSRTES